MNTIPDLTRHQVVRLYEQGQSYREIAETLSISHPSVSNIVGFYLQTGTYKALPSIRKPKESKKLNLDTLKAIELYKLQKPSIFLKEIRHKLLEDSVCDPETVPSRTYIHKGLSELGYSHKKITSVPKESQTPTNQAKYDAYLDLISDIDGNTMHFFDECSVIKSSGKRKFGDSYKGTRAIEVQRYASNATYTVNLLHSVSGIDYFNILEGPSNGQELLRFFIDALEVTFPCGISKLNHGDVVIMDNCGFHHGRQTEQRLTTMLAVRNIKLIFQPPYHPQLNTCEYCFGQLKQYLCEHEKYSDEMTEMAICDGLMEKITSSVSRKIFNHCGYL